MALIMHRLLDGYTDSHAISFFEQTYASILFQAADMSSQGISRYLAKLGSEAIRRDFHMRYIAMMYPKGESVGILIDSTSLPNDINLPSTAISNHGNGVVDEIRLIYVVDRETHSPIYYRAIPGKVVDVLTLKGTISDLKTMHVNVKYSVLDSEYNSESNLEELFNLGIDFITRLISNRGLYNELLVTNYDIVINQSNRIMYNNRLFFLIMNNVSLTNNRQAYAYIGVDTAKKMSK
jgi:hypothetical protein